MEHHMQYANPRNAAIYTAGAVLCAIPFGFELVKDSELARIRDDAGIPAAQARADQLGIETGACRQMPHRQGISCDDLVAAHTAALIEVNGRYDAMHASPAYAKTLAHGDGIPLLAAVSIAGIAALARNAYRQLRGTRPAMDDRPTLMQVFARTPAGKATEIELKDGYVFVHEDGNTVVRHGTPHYGGADAEYLGRFVRTGNGTVDLEPLSSDALPLRGAPLDAIESVTFPHAIRARD